MLKPLIPLSKNKEIAIFLSDPRIKHKSFFKDAFSTGEQITSRVEIHSYGKPSLTLEKVDIYELYRNLLAAVLQSKFRKNCEQVWFLEYDVTLFVENQNDTFNVWLDVSREISKKYTSDLNTLFYAVSQLHNFIKSAISLHDGQHSQRISKIEFDNWFSD